MYENKNLNIIHKGRQAFDLAIALVFATGYENDKAITCNGWNQKDGVLYLSSYKREVITFPYKLNQEEVADFVWGWLKHQKPLDKEPHGDGSTSIGFEITTQNIGYDGNLFAVRAVWLYYGK